MIDLQDFIVKQEDRKSSRKLYRHFCDNCLKDRGYARKSKAERPYCRTCFGKITHTGKVVSSETKTKMSLNHSLKNGGTHPLLGKRHSEETKAKLSRAAAIQCKNYKGQYLYNGLSGPIYMKSSWEVKYAEWLDQQGIKWTYEPEFTLSNNLTYLPDFQLSTGDIIEIKGYMRPDAEVKWRMFEVEYPQIKKSLLRKEDLKKLGILT